MSFRLLWVHKINRITWVCRCKSSVAAKHYFKILKWRNVLPVHAWLALAWPSPLPHPQMFFSKQASPLLVESLALSCPAFVCCYKYLLKENVFPPVSCFLFISLSWNTDTWLELLETILWKATKKYSNAERESLIVLNESVELFRKSNLKKKSKAEKMVGGQGQEEDM